VNNVLEYLTAFGLAGGAGAKAFVPVFLLGALHHTKYFELSAVFRWMADPTVLAVLGLLIVFEIWIDAHPDLGEYSDLAAYLPKLIAGFIAFAAVVGTVDTNLVQLGASGLLGGATATGVHYLRNRVRRPVREITGGVHDGLGKIFSLGEAGFAGVVGLAAVLVPLAAGILLLGAGLAAAWFASRAAGWRVPCPKCGQPIRPGAAVCPSCRQDLLEAPAPEPPARGAAG
jgi:hypothetical protein